MDALCVWNERCEECLGSSPLSQLTKKLRVCIADTQTFPEEHQPSAIPAIASQDFSRPRKNYIFVTLKQLNKVEEKLTKKEKG